MLQSWAGGVFVDFLEGEGGWPELPDRFRIASKLARKERFAGTMPFLALMGERSC